MKEHNKEILKTAIQNLPEYEPKDALWDFIQDDMDYDHSDQRIREGLQALPTYSPPQLVWNNIESNLSLSEESESGRVVSINSRRRWLSIAASVAVLFVAGWWFNYLNSDGADEMAFSTEIRDDNLLKEDWNDDDGAFDDLMALCKTKVAVCKTPGFQKLQVELDELNDAKNVLNSAVGKFGTNANLISQIKDLELERTEIMKEMIDILI
ncbi:MAG: hypothetical protein NXI23_23545 [Bacteroidetes bacterium]|jgi:hypothetical protein|nr:hypothetical protein [Bacteroidota bacterium]